GSWGGYWGNYYYPGNWYPGSYEGRANVLLGSGDGSFAAPNTTGLGYGYHTSAAVADVNGDGNQDFATVNDDTWTVSVLSGDGLGNLVGPADFSTGAYPYAVTAGDVDADGDADLVTANLSGNEVSVLSGDGLGSF